MAPYNSVTSTPSSLDGHGTSPALFAVCRCSVGAELLSAALRGPAADRWDPGLLCTWASRSLRYPA